MKGKYVYSRNKKLLPLKHVWLLIVKFMKYIWVHKRLKAKQSRYDYRIHKEYHVHLYLQNKLRTKFISHLDALTVIYILLLIMQVVYSIPICFICRDYYWFSAIVDWTIWHISWRFASKHSRSSHVSFEVVMNK